MREGRRGVTGMQVERGEGERGGGEGGGEREDARKSVLLTVAGALGGSRDRST